jgi:Domain of unknown function (DUF4375)
MRAIPKIWIICLLLLAGLGREAMAAKPDFEALKTIPLIEIIERTATPHTYGLEATGALSFGRPEEARATRAAALAKVEALEPNLRQLVWLVWVLRVWGSDPDEGMHTFFYLWGGDFAPQVKDALAKAGLTQQATAFTGIMDAFGPIYPLDQTTREKPFAWSQPATRIDEQTTQPQPLNAFDKRIIALGLQFGGRAEYGRALEGVVRGNPVLTAWASEARAAFPEDDRLRWLVRQLYVAAPEDMAKRTASWPAPYRQLYMLDIFNAEMLNGSVHQFFSNSSGNLAPDVATALREAGLPKHAEAVEAGMAMFGSPYPVDRKRRGTFLFKDEKSTDFDDKLYQLTGAVDDGEIGPAMLAIGKAAGILPR